MTLLRLLKQAASLYPALSWYDLLIAGLEELIAQNLDSRLGWYCPACMDFISWQSVTYEEYHVRCGTYLGDGLRRVT